MTSNCPEEYYEQAGYNKLLANYKQTLGAFVGDTKVLIAGDTLQVNDYAPFGWTMFDADKKRKRREEVFPLDKEKAFQLGEEMAKE
jgi:hypothetical protein